MNRVLICFKMATLAAVVFLCVQFGLLLHHANQTLSKLDPIVSSLGTVTANINKTLDEINRPCGGHASCGSLADLNKTLASVRGAVGQVEIAAKHENSQLSTLEAQERTLYSDLHSTLGNVNSFVVTGQQTEFALQQSVTLTSINTQPVLAEAHNSLAELTTSLASLNVVISNPAIPATLKAAQKASEATADSMVEVKGMAIEGHAWLHSMLHPKWPGRAYHVGLDLFHAAKPG